MQNGVQAIFTTEQSRTGKTAAALGVVSAGAGAGLWAWLVVTATSSMNLLSLSLLLVIAGVGFGGYSLAVRNSRQENERLRSALYELEVLVEPKNGTTDAADEADPKSDSIPSRDQTRHMSKTLALAIVEALILIIVYGGLVQEYTSNVNMQTWVRANIWPGAYVLSYNALFLVVGGLLGTLTFQLLLGKQGSQ